MKKIMTLIFLLFTLSLFADNTSDKKINNFIKSDTNFKFGRYEASKTIYWSTRATVGLTGLFGCFGFLSNQINLSNEIKSFTRLLNTEFSLDLKTLNNLADNLPYVVFGIHFLMSGTSNIPVYGGMIYGSLLITTSIAYTVFKSIDAQNFFWFNDVNVAIGDNFKDRFKQLHQKLFDVNPILTVGIISIILGIGEIIAYVFYNREMKKKKFPTMNKILSFDMNSITIKLDV
ncbi:MAG TPA: hypothetical protein PK771_11615 [Spirochaetota bacterium]|nr:hypothetical protein [Spirochaetota bacterium]